MFYYKQKIKGLRDDLTELDAVEKVDLVTKGVAPERSKGGELAALGSLLVTLGASAAAAAGSTIIPNLAYEQQVVILFSV